MSLMYKFVLQMWVQRRCDEAYVLYQYEMGRITEAEKDTILSTPQNPIV